MYPAIEFLYFYGVQRLNKFLPQNAGHCICGAMVMLIITVILFPLNSCRKTSEPVRYVIEADKISTHKPISDKQKQFLADFIPRITYENDCIRLQRSQLLDLIQELQNGKSPDDKEKRKINALLRNYDKQPFVWEDGPPDSTVHNRLIDLKANVDVIPVKLVMAQAIIESAWGTSRFARKGNNYFGIHCYKKGCGMKPSDMPEATFEVKVFDTPDEAISTYLHILNTGYAYKKLRKLRAEMRRNNEPLEPEKLATGLEHYAQIGDKYITLIHKIIDEYLPEDIPALLTEARD